MVLMGSYEAMASRLYRLGNLHPKTPSTETERAHAWLQSVYLSGRSKGTSSRRPRSNPRGVKVDGTAR
jgi:hypothetical protein